MGPKQRSGPIAAFLRQGPVGPSLPSKDRAEVDTPRSLSSNISLTVLAKSTALPVLASLPLRSVRERVSLLIFFPSNRDLYDRYSFQSIVRAPEPLRIIGGVVAAKKKVVAPNPPPPCSWIRPLSPFPHLCPIPHPHPLCPIPASMPHSRSSRGRTNHPISRNEWAGLTGWVGITLLSSASPAKYFLRAARTRSPFLPSTVSRFEPGQG